MYKLLTIGFEFLEDFYYSLIKVNEKRATDWVALFRCFIFDLFPNHWARLSIILCQ